VKATIPQNVAIVNKKPGRKVCKNYWTRKYRIVERTVMKNKKGSKKKRKHIGVGILIVVGILLILGQSFFLCDSSAADPAA
jgi:hypothetical protein